MVDEYRLVSTATALAIVVPARLQSDVNALRSVHDKAYRKWKPHINVLYPFVEPGKLDAAISIIKSALQDEESGNLEVNLDAVGTFTHRKNATIFLKPTEKSDELLQSLRRMLVKALGCRESEGTHSGHYVPHLTVGQAGLVGPGVERLVEKVKKLEGLRWNIKSLVVLKRQSSGEMKAVDEIVLSSQKQEGSEEKHDCSTAADGWCSCYCFSQGDWSKALLPAATIPQDTRKPTNLRVLSYNLMTEPLAPPLSIRAPLLLKDIASTSSESRTDFRVFCLQEVNDELLEFLLSDPSLQELYRYCTYYKDSALPSLRNLVTFASKPFRSFQVQFDERHKYALVVSFNDSKIQVANVHLTRALTNKAVRQKQNQMATLTRFVKSRLNTRGDIIVAGDFNLTTSAYTIETAVSRDIITYETVSLIGRVIDPSIWEDAFLVQKNSTSDHFDADFEGEEGATFDRQTNPLAAMFEDPIDNRPQRYDRILFHKGGNVRLASFGPFGFANRLGQCGSDHYGVFGEFTIETVPSETAVPGAEARNLQSRFFPQQKIELNARKRFISSGALVKNSRLKDVLLAPLGSYCMDTYFADSDVDLLVIGSVLPREFFDLAVVLFKALGSGDNGSSGFRAVHYVNSLVPIVELVINGIKFDMQYCQAVELLERHHSISPAPDLKDLVNDADLLSKLAPASLRPLNTFRDTAYLVTTIDDVPCYCVAHRFLSLYLKRRGLYSAKFGYLGGIHLSLMLNRVAKLLGLESDAKCQGRVVQIPPATLVRTFFEYYSAFNWANKVICDPSTSASGTKSSRSAREPVYIQAINTPTARINVASSCTRLSAQAFTSEFAAAKEKLDDGDWAWCLRSHEDCANDFLSQYGAFVRITLDIWNIEVLGVEKVKNMVGSLESRIPSLLVGLGKIEDLKGRAWPAQSMERKRNVDDDGTEFRGYYLVGISVVGANAKEKSIINGKVMNAVRTFETSVKELRELKGRNAWVEVDIVPKVRIAEMGLELINA